ncbi:MAG: hypothetical protein AMXMBFR42_30140 [Burkholderiales bacterium]
MSGRVAQLHPLGVQPCNNRPADCNRHATAHATAEGVSPMTGRELRAQLRMQRTCNEPVASCLPEKGGVATVAGAATGVQQADDSELRRVVGIVAEGHVEADDMRPCTACGNLSRGGRCLAAERGESMGAGIATSRTWRPSEPERPQRCGAFTPIAADPDRRTGRTRWPFLFRAQVELNAGGSRNGGRHDNDR